MSQLISQDFDVYIHEYSLRVRTIKHNKSSNYLPTLVFLHEGLGSINLWRNFPELLALQTGCNAMIYDRRGYGYSDPLREKRHLDYLHQEAYTFLPELLAHCGINRPILIGHSDGGSIALLFASEFPDNVRGMITEAAHVFVEDITLQGIQDAVSLYQQSDLKQKLSLFHGEKTDQLFWAWADTWLQAEFKQWNIESGLAKITCPALIIQGEDDEYGSASQVEAIVNQVPGKAAAFLVPNCGHNPHKEAQKEVLQAMKKFIGKYVY